MIEDLPKDVLEQLERLKTVNGITVTENGDMELQMAFDGNVVTFRGEEGELEQMTLLCYLHYIMVHFIDELADENGQPNNPDGITPGHVMCHLTDHLHQQYHQLAMETHMEEMSGLIAEMRNEDTMGAAAMPADEPDDSDDDEIVIHGSSSDPKRHH